MIVVISQSLLKSWGSKMEEIVFLGQRENPRMIGDVTNILAEMTMNQNPTWMVP
jgi:hypothetical protein